jgi:hypothetical protein
MRSQHGGLSWLLKRELNDIMVKYINTETAGTLPLSSTACALLLPLTVLSNKDNEIDKKEFIKSINWITDYRTWDKYWAELVSSGILVRLDRKNWMVSPHTCYTDDTSHSSLIRKWNEVCDAIK